MNELVERVARAISPKPWDQMSRNDRRNATITAEVAIREVREAVEGMVRAFHNYGAISEIARNQIVEALASMVSGAADR